MHYFRLEVTAFDNPTDRSNSLSESTELIVNLIGPEDGIVLVIDGTNSTEMELKRAKLQTILVNLTDFIVVIDHMVPRMVR